MIRQPIKALPARNNILSRQGVAPAQSEGRKMSVEKKAGLLEVASKENNVSVPQRTRCRSYVIDASILDEGTMTPTLKTTKLKGHYNLVSFRDEPPTMVEAVSDLTTVNEKVVLLLLERFQSVSEHAACLGDLLQPENASRWELMQQLLKMIEAAVYKIGKLHNCLVRTEDAMTLKHPCGAVSAFDALPSLRFQLQRIQQLTKNINTSLREKWTVEEITKALGDEAETVWTLPVHFGHCLEVTHALLHALSPAAMQRSAMFTKQQ